jgi:hypothetical protein
MANETFIAKFKNKPSKLIYCKKSELANYLTLSDFIDLKCIEIMNKGSDEVEHRPITPEQLLKIKKGVKSNEKWIDLEKKS